MLVSEITAFLEQAYDVLNQKYFDGSLTKVVITIQSSKAYGHYTVNEMWYENENGYHEINLGAETLDRPIENVIATLIHEMVHHFCALNGIKDTSRNHTYHNSHGFKKEAEKRGLIIGYDSRIGHSLTTPSPELIDFIKEQGWENVDLSRKNSGIDFKGGSGGRRVQNVRKYQCPMCGCSVRATKSVNIGCLDCGVEMPLVEN